MKNKKSYWLGGFVIIAVVLIFSYKRGETLEEKDYIMAMEFDCRDGNREITYESPILKKDEAQSVLDNGQKINSTQIKHYEDFVNEYNLSNASEIDLQHLKVIIVDQNLLNDEDEFSLFLKFLKEQREFAENIYVVANGGLEKILMEDEESIGRYIENLLDKKYEKQPQMAVTVGKLLASLYNENQTVFIPVISENKQIIGEWAVACGKQRGFIEEDEAKWYMLANAINCGCEIHYKDVNEEEIEEKYDFSIDISKISRQVSFYEADEKVYADIVVNIKGSGKGYGGQYIEDGKDKYNKEELLALCLTEKMYELAEKSQGNDFFNTFYELSNKDRGLWKKYKGNYEEYMEKLIVNIVVSVEFTN